MLVELLMPALRWSRLAWFLSSLSAGYLHWTFDVFSIFFSPNVDLTLSLSRETGTSFSDGKMEELVKVSLQKGLERCLFGRTFRANS